MGKEVTDQGFREAWKETDGGEKTHLLEVDQLDPNGEDIWDRFKEKSAEVQKDGGGVCSNVVTFAMTPGEFCGRKTCNRRHPTDELWSEEDRREFLLEILGA